MRSSANAEPASERAAFAAAARPDCVAYDAHALAAAACRRLHHDGEADAVGLGLYLREIGERAVAAGHDRDAGRYHGLPRLHLVAHERDGLAGRTYERYARFFSHAAREPGVLRQEPVAGMYGLGPDLDGERRRCVSMFR